MSIADALLIFVDAHGEAEGWLRLEGGAVAARGLGLDGLPALADPQTGAAVPVVAVVPGDTVAIHWVELPADLVPAQALAAARLAAAEVSAQPLADLHVAVGPAVEGGASRAVALVPALAMIAWIGRLQAAALDPDLIVPEPLLIAGPEEGYVRHRRGALPLYRGRSSAFAVEPELAELVTAGSPVMDLGPDAFEAGIAAAIADPPVNLRQGDFAKRRRWKIEWAVVRRLAMLGAALLIVTLAIQLALIMRYTAAADAAEAEATAVASRALGGRTGSDAEAALRRRLAELGGAGGGYGALAGALFAAVRATPNVELSALAFERDGRLRATVAGDSPAALGSIEQRISQAGFVVETGTARGSGAGPAVQLIVRAR